MEGLADDWRDWTEEEKGNAKHDTGYGKSFLLAVDEERREGLALWRSRLETDVEQSRDGVDCDWIGAAEIGGGMGSGIGTGRGTGLTSCCAIRD